MIACKQATNSHKKEEKGKHRLHNKRNFNTK